MPESIFLEPSALTNNTLIYPLTRSEGAATPAYRENVPRKSRFVALWYRTCDIQYWRADSCPLWGWTKCNDQMVDVQGLSACLWREFLIKTSGFVILSLSGSSSCWKWCWWLRWNKRREKRRTIKEWRKRKSKKRRKKDKKKNKKSESLSRI